MMLREALRTMDQVDGRGVAVPFSMSWVTLDRKRMTGGAIKTMKNLVRCGAKHNLQRNRQVAVKPGDGSGHPIPVHLCLILRVNGEPVL